MYEKKCKSPLHCFICFVAPHLTNPSLSVEPDEAPTGMLARGHYEAASKFADDDGHDYLKFEWSFDITKEWK